MVDRDRVKMARAQLRLTQERLGKAIGLDQAYISKIERGEVQDITVTTLARFADALQVSTDYLLGRQDIPPPPRKRPRPRTTVPVG